MKLAIFTVVVLSSLWLAEATIPIWIHPQSKLFGAGLIGASAGGFTGLGYLLGHVHASGIRPQISLSLDKADGGVHVVDHHHGHHHHHHDHHHDGHHLSFGLHGLPTLHLPAISLFKELGGSSHGEVVYVKDHHHHGHWKK